MKVIIFGGSSGMGLATARMLDDKNAEVIVASRSQEKLDKVKQELKNVQAYKADISKKEDIETIFQRIGEVDHVVVTCADLIYAPIDQIEYKDIMKAINSKFIGPVLVTQVAKRYLRTKGSLTFISGVASERPMHGGSITAAVNGALESFIKAMSMELAPIRVNSVSPGWVDTPIWNQMPGMTSDRKAERFSEVARKLPIGRIGRPEDIAHTIVYCLENSFLTGSTINVDGGHRYV